MSDDQLASLKINPGRLMEELHHSCKWGTGKRWGSGPNETGMSRLSLSDSDHTVRDWFVDTMRSLECKTTVDAMGNIFAVRPGLKEGPPAYAGSHLDTQPTGGRYDGILGVLAGMEMIRVLNENWIETEFPVGVINWTNEEGARFPKSMCASGVWAGETSLKDAYNLREVGSGDATMKSELERIGYLGSTPCSHLENPIGAHFELHIEQGPILESEQKKIGIVEGVQAYKWFSIEVTGKDAHTGTTSLENRSDALLTASKLMLHAHRVAATHNARASTGILTLVPGSTNTIPGYVRFTLDIRALADETVSQVESDLRRDFDLIAKHESVKSGNNMYDYSEGGVAGKPCKVSWTTDFTSRAVEFDADCIQCVTDSASALLGTGKADALTQRMTSGAGHDTVNTSKHAPSTMIFVPCKGGMSHNPEEFCNDEDCAAGTQVLLGAVLRYDRLRSDREEDTSWTE